MTEEQTGNLDPENEAEEADTSEEQTAEGQEADDSADDGELTEREKQFLARAKKAEAKLKEAKTSKAEAKPEPKKSNTDDFDYGQLSYLEIKGVKSDQEIEFVKKMMDRTGDSLKEVLNDDYVKNRLKSIREEASVKAATPSSTRRAQPSGKSSVDYWLAKGELPPNDQPQLRRDVLNARLEREKQASKFSNNPVVSSL